jgi:iron complex outermembrane receptor protein
MVISGLEETYQAWDGVPSYMLDTNRTYNGLGIYYDAEGNQKYYDNQTDNYRQTHYHLNWTRQLRDRWNSTIALHYTRGKGYYEEYEMDQYFSDYNLEDAVIGSDTITMTDLIRRRWLDNHFYGFTFSLNYDNKRKIKATIAGALNHYEGGHYGQVIWSEIASGFEKNYRWYENNSGKTDANIFTKINWQVSAKINIYGDLQLRRIMYDIEGIDNDLRDISQDHIYTFFNPKLGAYYEIDDRNKAYLSLAVGNREPNRSTLIDANPSRPYPVSEKLYNLEGGYRYSYSSVSASANIYYMHYKNQLVLTGRINDVGDPVMENADKSFRTGIETIFSFKFLKNLQWDFNLTLSTSRILGFTEYTDNWDAWPEQLSQDLGTTEIAFSPSVTGGSKISWEPLRDLVLSLYSKFVGKQYIDNTNSNERKLDPYFINDLLIDYEIKLKNLERLGFSLKINNITNTKYETNAWVYRFYSEGSYGVYDGYFPQAGINFLAGVDLRF